MKFSFFGFMKAAAKGLPVEAATTLPRIWSERGMLIFPLSASRRNGTIGKQ
jgi:hypothetical protein